MKTFNVNIHGARISFFTNSDDVLAAIRHEYSAFACELGQSPDLSVFLIHGETPCVEDIHQWKLAGSSATKKIYTRGEELLVVTSGCVARFSSEKMTVLVEGVNIHHIQENMKLIVDTQLSGVLQRNGVYRLHAAALSRNGAGAIIVAASEGGKTTTAVSMLERGFRILSDDSPFWDPARQLLLWYPVSMRVDRDIVHNFPRLHFLMESEPISFSNGEINWLVDIDKVYPGSLAESSHLDAVFFLKRQSDAASFSREIDLNCALEPFRECVMERDRRTYQHGNVKLLKWQVDRFRMGCRLLQGCRLYELNAGSDRWRIAEAIEEVM